MLQHDGRYHAMVTAAGGGYSRWNGVAVTRWHDDAGDRAGGPCCYLRDAAGAAQARVQSLAAVVHVTTKDSA